jgi:3-deoxy-D-manno-octulosonate 8-phosphate phosphatase (KDO 8-P phosphatase)
MENFSELEELKLLVVDVDGVLTDGTIAVDSEGRDIKFFNSLDGHGIRMWKRAGLEVAFLSGRACQATRHRAKELGVDIVLQDCHNKLPELKKLLERLQLSAGQVAYIGDDLTDLPTIRYVGFGAAVDNAVEVVKRYADYVTSRPGGRGAVREVIEYILKRTGKWQELMKRYLAEPDKEN